MSPNRKVSAVGILLLACGSYFATCLLHAERTHCPGCAGIFSNFSQHLSSRIWFSSELHFFGASSAQTRLFGDHLSSCIGEEVVQRYLIKSFLLHLVCFLKWSGSHSRECAFYCQKEARQKLAPMALGELWKRLIICLRYRIAPMVSVLFSLPLFNRGKV